MLFERGKALYLGGYFDRAVETLQDAEELARSPSQRARVLFYIALSHEGDGQPDLAARAFRQALVLDPLLTIDAEQFKPAVVELFRSARARLKGKLEVTAGRAAGRLWLDGQRVALPFTGPVAIGRHRLELRDERGALVEARQVVVHAGRVERLRLAASTPATLAAAALDRPDARRRWRPWTWAFGGATLVSAAVATAFSVTTASSADEGEQLLTGGLTDEESTRWRELEGEVNRDRLIANIGWGATGLFAATTIALVFFAKHRPEPRLARQQARRLAGCSGLSFEF